MSNLYIYEPATNGKVVIHTTMGDIEIELWSKEAPKACRNFLALIMEGYYDNCIFHRIVKNFIIQTGDPSGTGLGGQSFYGDPFEDEPHQRLKFSRRGLVGMANDNMRNSNRSQFFITLDRTDELQNKHTIFGKIAADGNTIFNVIKIGETEVGEDERPVYPPKIRSVEILDNPFDDIVPRITAAERKAQEVRRREAAKEQKEREERKKIKKRNTKVLSFGDEADEEDAEAAKEKKSLVRPDMDASAPESIASFENLPQPPVASSSKPKPAKVERNDGEDEDEYNLAKVRKQKSEANDAQGSNRQKEIEKMEANLRKLSRRRSGSPDSDDEKDAKRRKGPSVLEAELASYTRGRKSKGKGKLNDDDDVMAALGLFTKKMSSAPKEKATKFEGDSADAPREEEEQSGEGLDVDDDLGWMGHKLVEVRTGKDAEVSRRAEADYEVIDTRTTKGRGHLEPGRGGGGVHRGPPGRKDDRRDDRQGNHPRSRPGYAVGRGREGRGGGSGGGGRDGGGDRRRWD